MHYCRCSCRRCRVPRVEAIRQKDRRKMTERITTYLTMGVVLALVVNNARAVSGAINAFAGGISNVVTGIVSGSKNG